MWNLTLKMLGPVGAPCLNAKGKETHGLLPFSTKMLDKHCDALTALGHGARAKRLLAAGRAAEDLDEVLRRSPKFPGVEVQQKVLDLLVRHTSLAHAAGVRLLPKHHMMVHMALRMHLHGSPRWYTTFHDEAVNGMVATIGRSTHRWTFEGAVHRKYAQLQLLRGGRCRPTYNVQCWLPDSPVQPPPKNLCPESAWLL